MAGSITIVGLGPGDPALLTREAWECLAGCEEIWVRTARHPTVEGLPALPWRSFDSIYEREADFTQVYRAIVEELVRLAQRPKGVVYAVPGDTHVGEATVGLIQTRAAQEGLGIRCIAGLSFLEPTLHLLELDALGGLFVADALDLALQHHPLFPPNAHVLIAQLYSSQTASDVKLVLMNQYPEKHPVKLVQAAGTPRARVQTLKLYELDRQPGLDHLSALYLPPLAGTAFEDFQETVAHLRAPEGCPWDREQTHLSLRPNLQEEAYEVLEALDRQDPAALAEELGDLLLQIVLQTQIATDGGEFRMVDVLEHINAKLHRRHPHVFGASRVDSVGEVLRNWEAIKAEERNGKAEGERGALEGIPTGLPALLQANLYQQRVARVGFDWPALEGVFAKVEEELGEVRGARNEQQRRAEVGDLLFAVVNLARWLEVEPESALRESNRRFRTRFKAMETQVRARGQSLGNLDAGGLDDLWRAAKRENP